MDAIDEGWVDLVINIPIEFDELGRPDGYHIRRRAVEAGVPVMVGAPFGGWMVVMVARTVMLNIAIPVRVDGAAEPCLTVQALSGPRTGSVALWVGNNSPGRFAGLTIKPEPTRPEGTRVP